MAGVDLRSVQTLGGWRTSRWCSATATSRLSTCAMPWSAWSGRLMRWN
jgi:hypothetical protein